MAFVLAAGWLLAAYELARVAPRRPFPIAAGLVGAALTAALNHRPYELPTERALGRVYLGGIVGGMLGELAQSLLIGAPLAVDHSIGWLLAGAAGIGGAVGVGMSMLVSMGWSIALLLLLLWRYWRRRPAA